MYTACAKQKENKT